MFRNLILKKKFYACKKKMSSKVIIILSTEKKDFEISLFEYYLLITVVPRST